MKLLARQYWIYISFILLGLVVLVFQNYSSLDEPNILWELKSGTGWSGYYKRFIGEGRPIYGILQLAAIDFGGTLANLKYFRIISIVLTFLFCYMIFYYLKRKGVHSNTSFIIAAMIFSLPGFSVFISWAQQYPHHLSSMLSFCAGILIVEVFAKHLGEKKLSKSKENAFIFFALILQIVSLFIYQSLALAFVIPSFFTLILKPEISYEKRILFFTLISIVFIFSLGIYFLLFKWSLHSFKIEMVSRGTVGGINLPEKLFWFAKMLKEASKLHLLLFKNSFLGNIFSTWIAFILVRDLIKKRFLDLIFLLLFCVFLCLPHLIISESWGASRNFVLISLILVFYTVVRSLEMISIPSIRLTGIIGFVFICIMCFNIWEGWVKPMKKDYSVMYEFTKKLPVLMSDTLIVEVSPPLLNMHEKQSVLKCYYDEFNQPVFYPKWPIEPVLKCLYEGLHPEISTDKINSLLKVNIEDSIHLSTIEFNKNKFSLNLNYQ